MFIDHREEILKSKIQLLKNLASNLVNIENAYNLYQGLYLQTLTEILEINNFNLFIHMEEFGYRNLIKNFEEDYHYERCLNIFDKAVSINFDKKIFKRRQISKKENKISFFINNIASEMAHIDLFINFIESIDKKNLDNFKIDIFTITQNENKECSKKLKVLIEKKKFNLFRFKTKNNLYDTFEDLINFYIEGGYQNMIFLGPPLFISYLSKCLPNQFSWWSMKYKINIFPDLKKRYIGGRPSESSTNSKYNWIVHGYFISKVVDNNLKLKVFNKKKIKFFTIGREEKIRNFKYLNCVKKILNTIPNSEFYFTGRKENLEIKEFFKNNKLDSRVFFLGWLNDNDKGIGYGDIFLDTPNLSGIVAANNFSAGVPVIFFNDSNFYLNFHKNNLVKKNNKNLIFEEIINDWYFNSKKPEDNYVSIAIKLATNEYYRENYSRLSRYLAEQYIHSPKEAKLDLLFNEMVC